MSNLKHYELDPHCGANYRLKQVLGSYEAAGSTPKQLTIVRHCIVASHLCKCARCSTYAGLLLSTKETAPCRE